MKYTRYFLVLAASSIIIPFLTAAEAKQSKDLLTNFSALHIGAEISESGNLSKSVKEKKFAGAASQTIKPPFIGKRFFNTDPEGSGTGTPQYYLKINKNNYFSCGFAQVNQADGTVTKEEVSLGKFKTRFDCNFKKEIGGKHSYQIKGSYIYELDENKKIIESSKSEFYKAD